MQIEPERRSWALSLFDDQLFEALARTHRRVRSCLRPPIAVCGLGLQCCYRFHLGRTMKRRTHSVLPGVSVLVILIAPAAQSAQLGHYVGGFYGFTDKQDDVSSYDAFTFNVFYPTIDLTTTSHVVNFDTEDQGYAALLGYRLHANFAIEALFGHFGEVRYRAQSDGTTRLLGADGTVETLPLSVETTLTSKMTGMGLHALGIWPISQRWELYGRVGVQYSTIRTEASLERTGGTEERFQRAEAGISRDGALDLATGVGMAMSVSDIYGVRVEYLRVFDAGSDLVARGDAQIFSLGVIVAF